MNESKIESQGGKGNASDHLANERTFLAWIRTGIGIMAFGFVVVKFSLFIKQLAVILGDKTAIQPKGYSSITGIILVALGIMTIAFAFLRYRSTEKQLNAGNYAQSGLLLSFITISIVGIGLFLLIYLVRSI
jgi:putative membrane protein